MQIKSKLEIIYLAEFTDKIVIYCQVTQKRELIHYIHCRIKLFIIIILLSSGTPATRKGQQVKPILIQERIDFLMVIIANSITCGRVRMRAATVMVTMVLRKMVAILQPIG